MVEPTAALLQELIRFLSDWAANRPEQTGGAIAIIAGVLYNYRKTGNLPVGRLPWHYFRSLLRDLGDKYFGVKRPKGVPALVVRTTPEQVAKQLRTLNYESVDLYSYEMADEAWGFRRPSGTRPDPMTGEPAPTETHPRGFRTAGDECLILCHDEASRLERLGMHLSESMLDYGLGRETITDDLDALNLSYREIESEKAAGIEVVPPTG